MIHNVTWSKTYIIHYRTNSEKKTETAAAPTDSLSLIFPFSTKSVPWDHRLITGVHDIMV